MKRAFAVLPLLVLGTICRADDTTYLPLKEGMKWTYERKQTTNAAGFKVVKDNGTVVCACQKTEKVGEEATVVLDFTQAGSKDTKFTCKLWVASTTGRIAVIKASGEELTIVPADLEKKEKKKVEVKTDQGGVTIESTVAEKEEAIETPAGKYSCLKVTGEVTAAGTKITRTAWYAKGIGLVKLTKHVEAPGAEVTEELVLKSFDKGEKKDPEKK